MVTVSGGRVRTLVGGDEGGDPARLVRTDVWVGQVQHHLLLRHLNTTINSSLLRKVLQTFGS